MRGGTEGPGSQTQGPSGAIICKRQWVSNVGGGQGKKQGESMTKQNWGEIKKLNLGLTELNTP